MKGREKADGKPVTIQSQDRRIHHHHHQHIGMLIQWSRHYSRMGKAFSQNDNAPIHSAHVVKNWYEECESKLEHMEWPPRLQISILLSICGASWSDELETITIALPSCQKELEQVLMARNTSG